jgi:hypothetical protein
VGQIALKVLRQIAIKATSFSAQNRYFTANCNSRLLIFVEEIWPNELAPNEAPGFENCLRGWIEYYGRYAPSALYPLLRYVNQALLAWVMRTFKRFKGYKVRASQFLQQLAKERADLFVHWNLGMTGVFA